MRSCRDCAEPIGIRATRCGPCRRAYRTAYQRKRVRADRDMPRVTEDGIPLAKVGPDEVVSDGRTIGGAAHQAPSPYAPRPAEPTTTEVQDGRVESPATRQARRTPQERAHIPAWIRADRQRYHQEVASQNRPHASRDLAPNGVPWGDLGAAAQHFGMTDIQPNQEPHVFDAVFTNSNGGRAEQGTMADSPLKGGRGYGVDHLGRSFRR